MSTSTPPGGEPDAGALFPVESSRPAPAADPAVARKRRPLAEPPPLQRHGPARAAAQSAAASTRPSGSSMKGTSAG